MSGISSGIGIISGINTTDLIDQLIAIEKRPVDNLQGRVKAIDVERAAFVGLSARLLAIRNAVSNFDKESFFKRFAASSSDESVLVASAGENTVPGGARIRVHSLVSTHSLITRGFADSDRSSVGVGSISVELGHGRINVGTDLDSLHGGRGARRGVIRITDRSGASAEVDLRQAFTLEDVIGAINSSEQISVRASVTGLSANGATGDRLVIEDTSGGTGTLTVEDTSGGAMAGDLGIAGSVTSGRIDGSNLVELTAGTSLSSLNDGNGVDRLPQGARGSDLSFSTSFGDFSVLLTDVLQLDADLRTLNNGDGIRTGIIRITDRSGASAEVDLSNATTVRDVRDAINDAGLNVSAAIVNSQLFLTDSSNVPERAAGDQTPAPVLKVEDVTGHTAADFGLAGETEDDSIFGRDVSRISTVGDLIRAINFAPGNDGLVHASISADGKGITLGALGFDNQVTVTPGQDDLGRVSQTAADLGLVNATFSTNDPFVSQRLVSGLNTTLLRTLNGGNGVDPGVVSFTDGLNQSASIDFSSAQTVQDVVDLINATDTIGLVASVSASGSGISLRDESGGTATVRIEDVSGRLAQQLHIAGTRTLSQGDTIESGNLQRQYVSRQTLLSDLRGGNGIPAGSFEILDTKGQFHIVNIGSGTRNVGGVIDAINAAGGGTVQARINDTGDGILVTDSAGGTLPLKIEDRDGGTTAAQLQLAGTSKDGETSIDGSYEFRIETGPGTTLNELASKLNALGAGISASVLNDGGSVNPFSLSITSGVAGRRGELVIDSTGVNLGLDTLSRAHDAVVSVSQGEGAASRLLTSSSNTLDNIIPGVSIDLLSTSNQDVEINAKQDVDSIVESIQTFITAFNDLQNTIDESTSFNSDTLERGPLFGDPVPDQIRNRLQRTMISQVQGVPETLSRLFQVGIRVGAGNRLEFNEDRFRNALADSPKAVEDLFAHPETGFGAIIQQTLDGMTDDFDGLLTRKDNLLGDQQQALNDRIARLNQLIDGKRARLERQFANLESVLSSLQGQQSALNQLSQASG